MKQAILIPILLIVILFSSLHEAWSQAPTPPGGTTGAPPKGSGEATKLDQKIVNALKSGKIMLNFDAVDIKAITKVMAEITERSIILDKNVTGTLTILSPRKVVIKEAWDLYVSALEASGFGVVDYGKYIKVMILADARKEDTKYVGVKVPKIKKGYLVALVLMQHADAELMANTLRPMITNGGIIASYRPSNAVVITDTWKNASRLVEIVRQLDANYRGTTLRLYQPKYIKVTELAKSLQPIFTSTGTTPEQQIKVSAYEPTNSLLIMAPESEFIQIESVLSDLDSEERIIKPEKKQFRVHYLQNGNAEEIAKIMTAMMEEKKRIVEEVKKEQEGTQAAQERAKEAFISTKVSADPSTNSLVLFVTDEEYEELKRVIASLDTDRKQVLISAIIAEVSLKKILDLGARFHVITQGGVASFQGGLTLQQIFETLSSGSFVAGGISTEGTEIEIGGNTVFIPNIFAVIRMLQTDTDFNLLSAPRLLTEDHKESSINVGQIVPFATGQKFDALNQPIITFDYKDVGLNLKVTPHISQSDKVRMEITQVIKEVVDTVRPSPNIQVPVLSNRELKTTITLGNNQTIIIGGLISNRTLKTMKKVPFFHKLPLIGELFKDTNATTDRTTLFIFLTPHIINTPEELEQVTNKYGRVLHEDRSTNDEAPFIIDEDKQETH